LLADETINDDCDHQNNKMSSSSSNDSSLHDNYKDCHPDISNAMCYLSINDYNYISGLKVNNMQKDQLSKQILQQKQQRLLLLRHSYYCRHNNNNYYHKNHDNDDDDNICPVTPHCKTMKLVWYHMSHCVDHQCKIPHCLSSRKILSHYKSCKHISCAICRPVRLMIAQSNSDL
jgi:E1A/CREB-binding protein